MQTHNQPQPHDSDLLERVIIRCLERFNVENANSTGLHTYAAVPYRRALKILRGLQFRRTQYIHAVDQALSVLQETA